MKSINKLGLVGLLAGALTLGASVLPQNVYGEHKGKLEVEINEEGYSIRLPDKKMPNNIKAIFLYNAKNGRATLALGIRDELTGDSLYHIIDKYGLSPFLSVESVRPDSVMINTHRDVRKVEPTEQEIKMWKDYLKALHQEDVQKEWHDKYYRRKK